MTNMFSILAEGTRSAFRSHLTGYWRISKLEYPGMSSAFSADIFSVNVQPTSSGSTAMGIGPANDTGRCAISRTHFRRTCYKWHFRRMVEVEP